VPRLDARAQVLLGVAGAGSAAREIEQLAQLVRIERDTRPRRL
jgi:hypothetical protein